jgi:hypothetical protein
MFFSRQLVNVGNSVPTRTWGGGSTRDGHHLGIFAGSWMANGSLGNIEDSGDALGSRCRRLGDLVGLWADHG